MTVSTAAVISASALYQTAIQWAFTVLVENQLRLLPLDKTVQI